MNIEGKHLILDAFDCNPDLLNSREHIESLLLQAAKNNGMQVLSSFFHLFHPQGVTGVLVLSTSHMSIHTWPEKSYASIDYYTCGDADPESQTHFLLNGLGAKSSLVYTIARGRKGKQLILPKEMAAYDSSKGADQT
ncbi:adenosylmethionine decarboxylase [Metabacillus sp. JX24]|uniref:adenosylmethionine decarboxylase n=1 Tax=Metabacillus sp. JX24 TaxID=3240759 RepID=UPI003510306C